jgi:hypothetical protein
MAAIGQELLNVPFGDMVESLGMAIADAQHALDMNSVMMAQVFSGSPYIDVDDQGKEVVRDGIKVTFGGRSLSLLELGFTPTFYQFVDTIIEVKISISMQSSESTSQSSSERSTKASASVGFGRAKVSCSSASVSASYAAKNSFSAEGASLIRTKLVPLPPPAILEQRIRKLMDERQASALVLSPDVLSLSVGQNVAPADLKKTLAAKDATGQAVTTGITWASSNTAVATVSTAGEVTAVAAGVADITATAGTSTGLVKVAVKAT